MLESTTTSRQKDPLKSSLPWGLRAQRPCFFVAPPRRWPTIDLLLYLKSETVSPVTNGMLFIGQNSKYSGLIGLGVAR